MAASFLDEVPVIGLLRKELPTVLEWESIGGHFEGEELGNQQMKDESRFCFRSRRHQPDLNAVNTALASKDSFSPT